MDMGTVATVTLGSHQSSSSACSPWSGHESSGEVARPRTPGLLSFVDRYMDLLDEKARRSHQTCLAVRDAVEGVFGDQLANWRDCMRHEQQVADVLVRCPMNGPLANFCATQQKIHDVCNAW